MRKHLILGLVCLFALSSVSASAATVPPVSDLAAPDSVASGKSGVHTGSAVLTIDQDGSASATRVSNGGMGPVVEQSAVTPSLVIAPSCTVSLEWESAQSGLIGRPSADCSVSYYIEDMTLKFYETNVTDSSEQYQLGKTIAVPCGWSKCDKQGFLSGIIVRTAEVHAVLHYKVKKAFGQRYEGDLRSDRIPYNDAGAFYPVVAVAGRPGMVVVPFRRPYTGWGICEDDPFTPPTCWRDPQFPSNLRSQYADRGWLIPQGTIEAHHISPLEFGGGNSMDNGVLLTVTDHALFTAWFRRFNPVTWGGNLPFGTPGTVDEKK